MIYGFLILSDYRIAVCFLEVCEEFQKEAECSGSDDLAVKKIDDGFIHHRLIIANCLAPVFSLQTIKFLTSQFLQDIYVL